MIRICNPVLTRAKLSSYAEGFFFLQEVDAASDDYLRKVHDLSPDKRRAEMERIQKLFKDAKNYGDEKVSIAIQITFSYPHTVVVFLAS